VPSGVFYSLSLGFFLSQELGRQVEGSVESLYYSESLHASDLTYSRNIFSTLGS
jgi:hypothetical protein